MRMPLLGLALAAAVAASPAAAAQGSAGPFVGRVAQGHTTTHQFDNNPTNNACVDIVATYRVTLAYAPPGDTLTLTAAGYTDTGSDGAAAVVFQHGICTEFDITVTGTAVGSIATYGVTVTRELLGPIAG